MTAGQTYTITKYVGVDDSQDTADPAAAAQSAGAAARRPPASTALLGANNAAWAALWNGRIDVLGNPTLATEVNASEFYLWSSTRARRRLERLARRAVVQRLRRSHLLGRRDVDVPVAARPASRPGGGHERLPIPAARRRRSSTPRRPATGARASRGRARSTAPSRSRRRSRSTARACTSSTSPPTSRWPSGSTTSRPATATGSRSQGWPVISGAAEFWASRVTRGRDGRVPHRPRHRTRRGEPERRRRGVHQCAAANDAPGCGRGGARRWERPAPATWSQIAARTASCPSDATRAIHPEFAGYDGQLVKQADVTLLQYPWLRRCPPRSRRTTSTTTCRAPIPAARR